MARKTPYPKPPSRGSRGFSSQSASQVGQPGGVKCFSYGGKHYRNSCLNLSGARKCYNYGKEGHLVVDCSSARGSRSQSYRSGTSQHRGGTKPHATSMVYVMSGSEVVGSGNLIIGNCLLYGMVCCVLFDSRVTHSFCVRCLCA